MRINRERLLKGLRAVSGAVPTRSPNEVLLFVRLEGDADGQFQLTATDLETAIQYGSCNNPTLVTLVPPKRLAELLRNLDCEEIDLDTTDSGIAVRDGDSCFELSAPPVDGYPITNQFDGGRWYELSCCKLSEALRLTLFAASEESTRFALSGVHLEFADADHVRFVATDSRKLAIASVGCSCEGEPDSDVLETIPGRACQQLLKLLPASGSCRFAFGLTGGIVFEAEDVRLYTRLLEGRFPNYEAIIPESPPVEIEFVAGEMAQVLRQAMVTTSEDSRTVDVSMLAGCITATSSATDVGRSTATRQLSLGADADFAVDPQYVLDMLHAVGEDAQLTLYFTGAEELLLFSRDDGYRYVLAPLARCQEGGS